MDLNIGIIGLGRWGTNYLRTLNEIEGITIRWVCSTKESTINESLSKVNLRISPKKTTDYRKVLKDKKIDAVIIASSGSTHYKIAANSLKSKKHVLVEKPVAFSSKEVAHLAQLSKKNKKILMAGHLHLYNPGIVRLKQDINKGVFGKIRCFYLSHFGNGPIRSDMSALWDFSPHSISILLYLVGENPLKINARGESYIRRGIKDVVTLNLTFSGNIFATATASWIYPLKEMRVIVAGEKKYAVFDDYAKEEKLKYFDAPRPAKGEVELKNDRYYAQKISSSMPLTEEINHFVDCIINKRSPITDVNEILAVTRVIEAADKSLQSR